jgi:hypothetical protein
MTNLKSTFLAQIDEVLTLYTDLAGQTKYPDFSDLSYADYSKFRMAALAVISRVSGSDSVYMRQASNLSIDERNFDNNLKQVPLLGGILLALRNDVDRGFLESMRELVHSDLFSDFLEMADYFLNDGYKDAAAVIGGGVLETHLRQLCIKHNIALDIMVGSQMQAKKADRLNNDLVGNNVYSRLDQKNVTAWLDLRNKAAHAQYNEYTKDQVVLFLQGIRDFISRHPA